MGWSGASIDAAKRENELLNWLTDRELIAASYAATTFLEHAEAMARLRATAERRRRIGQAVHSELPFSLRFADSVAMRSAAMRLYTRVYGSRPLDIILQ